jgi:hypothetical protein
MKNLPKEYEIDNSGFLHQKGHHKYEYTVEYRKKQSTNEAMSYLRLGWLSASLSYEEMKSMKMVDIGCGSGEFVKHCQGKFSYACGYDVVGDSISEEELTETEWDVIYLSDVLEHYENVEDLFKLKWKYAVISFPETPKVEDFNELKTWRHYKPNEHLYYMNIDTFENWISDKDDCWVYKRGHFEDLIRARWDESKPNIATFLLARLKDPSKEKI